MHNLNKLVAKIVEAEKKDDSLAAMEAFFVLSNAICDYYKIGFESGYKMGRSHANGKVLPLTDPAIVGDALEKTKACKTELVVNFDLYGV